jgi:hypothetical protein
MRKETRGTHSDTNSDVPLKCSNMGRRVDGPDNQKESWGSKLSAGTDAAHTLSTATAEASHWSLKSSPEAVNEYNQQVSNSAGHILTSLFLC